MMCGIGTHFAHDALARGASKVYAIARNPRAWDDDRIVPHSLFDAVQGG